MRLRNLAITVLLLLIAFAPLAATGAQEEVDPVEPQEDVRPVEPDEEDPWDTEEDDPLAPAEEDDPWDTEEDDPLAPAEEDDPWDTEEDDPLAPAEEDDPLAIDEEEPWDTEEDDPLAVDEEEPWDTAGRDAIDVIAEHERTTIAYDLFGDEFAEAVGRAPRLAYFIPSDEAFEDWDREDLTDEELATLAERHVAAGMVADQPLEFVDSFMTMDGETINVSLDPEGRPVLNGSVTVLETIEVSNGFVYIIDGRLDDARLGLIEEGPPEHQDDED